MTLERLVEPAADHTALAHHLILAGTSLSVIFGSSLLLREIAEESIGSCRGLWAVYVS